MERSSSVNLKTLADKLTTELTGTYTYVVTDDVQLFSIDMQMGGESYIPVILRLITTYQDPNTFVKTEMYQMSLRLNKELSRDTLYADIQSFVSSQVNETIGTDYVTKTYNSLVYSGDDVVNGVEYYLYDIDFTWVYSLAVVGSMAVIEINNVSIPFLECDITHDIAYISNETSGDNYRMTNDIIILTIPLILSNTGVSALYDYINSNEYNNAFTLEINGVSRSVALKQGSVRYIKNGLITNMILRFETYYPRVTFTLDGEVIPNTAWRFEGKKEMRTAKRSASDTTKGYASGKIKTWSLNLVKNTSDVYAKIYDDLYGNDKDITYTLVRDGVTYTVIMTTGVEEYTETGDMTINCQFVEYGG